MPEFISQWIHNINSTFFCKYLESEDNKVRIIKRGNKVVQNISLIIYFKNHKIDKKVTLVNNYHQFSYFD